MFAANKWNGAILGLAFAFLAVSPGWAWNLDLQQSVVVKGQSVRLADLSAAPLSSAIGDLVLAGKGDPGTAMVISRSTILRKLVEAGFARGVSFSGSDEVRVVFSGREISSESLRPQIRTAVQALMPAAVAGAPDSWFDLDIPETDLALEGLPEVTLDRHNPLDPGRNLVRVRLQTGDQSRDLNVTVNLHVYGEVPAAAMEIKRQTPLTPTLFNWTWLDLSEVPRQAVTGRDALVGACAGRTLSTGDQLRLNDLKPIPAVNAGDMVDLQITRGGLVVTVRALARQAGCLGQTIPVRNELNGRLVNARVAAPGLVEWRR